MAIGDLWDRAGVESVTAYIDEGENEPSRRLAASLGFTVRSQGRGRFGEPMTPNERLGESVCPPSRLSLRQADRASYALERT